MKQPRFVMRMLLLSLYTAVGVFYLTMLGREALVDVLQWRKPMRVIAGKFRSRKLNAPPGTNTRPTSDRLRETLFNVVGPRISDSVWLDLYSGTGAVGIEAISRGARQVYFVESEKKAARIIRDNLKSLQIEDGFEVLERESAQAVRLLDSQVVLCDFCFLDPPYESHGAYEQILGFISQSRLINAESIVIAEHDKHFDPGGKFGALERYRELKQGDAVLSFYRLGVSAPSAT